MARDWEIHKRPASGAAIIDGAGAVMGNGILEHSQRRAMMPECDHTVQDLPSISSQQ
jgi:hypothetical protein